MEAMEHAPQWIRRNRVVCALLRHPKTMRLTTFIEGFDGPTGVALQCPCGRKAEPVAH
jgi:hypothetical protein